MSNSSEHGKNVIDLFTRKPLDEGDQQRIIRLAPECDDLEMLYSNDSSPDKLYSMKILCWALRADGSIDAMVPWLNQLVSARELNDPLNGRWEGYFNNRNNHAFFEAPSHKVAELESAHEYFSEPTQTESSDTVVQEIVDHIGTHAVFTKDRFKTLTLVHVLSWRLHDDGKVLAMLVDENKVRDTPVLIGDDALYPAQQAEHFCYFFHHQIANRIKQGDGEALAAFTQLTED